MQSPLLLVAKKTGHKYNLSTRPMFRQRESLGMFFAKRTIFGEFLNYVDYDKLPLLCFSLT